MRMTYENDDVTQQFDRRDPDPRKKFPRRLPTESLSSLVG